MSTPGLPPGLDAIMDYIGQAAATYGHLKWNEVAKLKADMMNVRARWLAVSPIALEAKCLAIGLREPDTATVLDLLRRMQQGRRLVPAKSYRDFRFQQPVDPPARHHSRDCRYS